MSGKRNISQLDRLLQEIGIKGRVRDSDAMRALTSALIHPDRISESEFLGDDDTLKISAHHVIEDFEAVTNGMSRPDSDDSAIIIDEDSPLYPWKLLSEAVAAFYEGDTKTMMKAVRKFPKNSAVSNLRSTFEVLAGKPLSINENNIFINKIRVRNQTLSQGLEILDEAASYPDLLRKEILFYIRKMSQENQEAGKRLYYWAMEILSEEEALVEKDEIDPAKLNARLKIAGELLKKAEGENLLSTDIFSNIITYLNLSYPLIKALLPTIPMLPTDTVELQQWFTGTAAGRRTADAGWRQKRKTERKASTELFLFDMVS